MIIHFSGYIIPKQFHTSNTFKPPPTLTISAATNANTDLQSDPKKKKKDEKNFTNPATNNQKIALFSSPTTPPPALLTARLPSKSTETQSVQNRVNAGGIPQLKPKKHEMGGEIGLWNAASGREEGGPIERGLWRRPWWGG
eukprot:c24239_g3_i2 orf=199-621(-)